MTVSTVDRYLTVEIYTLHIPVSAVDRYLTVEVYALHIPVSTVDRYLTVEVYALHIPVSTVDRFYAVSNPVHMNIHFIYGMYTHVLMCGMYIFTL